MSLGEDSEISIYHFTGTRRSLAYVFVGLVTERLSHELVSPLGRLIVCTTVAGHSWNHERHDERCSGCRCMKCAM